MVSQTQDDTGPQPVDDDSDNEDSPIVFDSKVSEHDNISQQLNIAMDRIDDYHVAEIKTITDHRYLSDISELKVEYTHGEQS